MSVVKYVLQVQRDIPVDWHEDVPDTAPEGADASITMEMWEDVVTVEVPLRTKIVTAMRTAAREAGIELPPEGVKVRLLPMDVAEPTELLPPAPQPGPRQVRL